MYTSDFESPFLDQTDEFYRVKGELQLNENTVCKMLSVVDYSVLSEYGLLNVISSWLFSFKNEMSSLIVWLFGIYNIWYI